MKISGHKTDNVYRRYRIVDGERRADKTKKLLEIDPSAAEIVRLVFELHLRGAGAGKLGVKAIADHLQS